MSNTTTTKFWQGQSFYIALLLAIGSAWGITNEQVAPIISSVFGIGGGLLAIREKIKSTAVDWLTWIKSPNTWNYVFAAVAAIVPKLPAGLGPKVSELITAIAGKNWPATITTLLSIFAMLYFIITGGAAKSKAVA